MNHSSYKIGIVGGGAMGSLFSFLFQRAGVPSVIYELNGETVRSMGAGLKVRTNHGDITVPVKISGNPSDLSDCTHILISVKSYGTTAAMKGIARFISPDCVIVTLQNGLGNCEAIHGVVPSGRVVFGTTSMGAAKLAPGEVTPGGTGETVIGGADSGAVISVKSFLEKAGIPVRITGDPHRALWEKAIVNAAINPLGALLSIPNGEIIKSKHLIQLQESIIKESVTVAAALGVPVDTDDSIARTRTTCENTAGNLCSMLQDIMFGRKTEIDSINGMIILYGKGRGIAVPYNESVYSLVKLREQLSLKIWSPPLPIFDPPEGLNV